MPAILPRLSPQTDTVPITIDVAFDPTQPVGQRFTFTQNGVNNNLLQVTDDVEITLNLTVPDGVTAQFSTSPLTVVTPPSLDPPTIPPPTEPHTYSVILTEPPHFFAPWSFRVAIDAVIGGQMLNGITSQSFFVSLPAPTAPVALTYVPTDGTFNLPNAFPVESAVLLVNTVFPLTASISVSNATFAAEPVVFTGLVPDWIQNITPAADGASLTFTINEGAQGQGSGFQFAVQVDGVTVLSPDPILVNATLGDG